MNQSTLPLETPFEPVIEALLDVESEPEPQLLYRLSDLEGREVEQMVETWPNIPVWRRRTLLRDMEHLAENNHLLSYEAICRLAIDDADPEVRFLAVRSMYIYEPADLIEDFLQMLEADPNQDVRAVCAATLGKFVYLGELDKISDDIHTEIVECLLRVAESKDSRAVRRRAVESLGYASNRQVPQLIEEAFASEHVDWLSSALFAMGRSNDRRWIPLVRQMLDHHLPVLRQEAARAAGELEMRDEAPRLIELLNDTQGGVRMAAAWSLSQVGGENVKEALLALFERTENQEEANYLQDALDNLSFNEELNLFGLMEFADDFLE